MAEKLELDENDQSFLEYIERLGPQCKSIKDLIKAEIQAAMTGVETPTDPQRQSGSYLERQNEMLLQELMRARGLSPSTPGASGLPNGEQDLKPVAPKNGPVEQVKPKPKAFWR